MVFSGYVKKGDLILHQYNKVTTGQIIYILVEGDKVYQYFPYTDDKVLHYDFSLIEGDIVNEGEYKDLEITKVSSITLDDNKVRKVIELGTGSQQYKWIQGIGEVNYGLLHNGPSEEILEFVCAKINGETLYQNPEISDEGCISLACEYPLHSFELINNKQSIEIINQNSRNLEFSWDLGDGHTSKETNPKHDYEKPGCYKVKLKVINECGEEQSVTRFASLCDNKYWNKVASLNDEIKHFSIGQRKFFYNYGYSNDADYQIYELDQDLKLKSTNITALNNIPSYTKNIAMWDENRGIALSSKLYITQNGITWESQNALPLYSSNEIKITSNGEAWISGGEKHIFKTSNYGQDWEQIDLAEDYSNIIVRYTENQIIRVDAYKQYTNETYVGMSTDGGQSWQWQYLSLGYNSSQWLSQNVGYFIDPTNDLLHSTIDGGNTWQAIPNTPACRNFELYSESNGWISDADGMIHYTNDKFATLRGTNCTIMYSNQVVALSQDEAYTIIKEYNEETFESTSNIHYFDDSSMRPCGPPDEKRNINIFPNPTTSHVWIEIEDYDIIQADLYNVSGQIIHKDIHCIPIDLSDYANGIYFIKIWDNGGVVSIKKIVKN